jgi:hypothetical protein
MPKRKAIKREAMVSLPSDGGFWCDPANLDSWYAIDGEPVIRYSDGDADIGEKAVGEPDDSSCRSYRDRVTGLARS